MTKLQPERGFSAVPVFVLTMQIAFIYLWVMKKIIVLGVLLSIFISGCQLFKKDPQEAVTEGISKFVEVKKMKTELTVKGTIVAPAGETPSKVQFSFESIGSSDVSDEKTPQLDLAIKISAAMDGKEAVGEAQVRTLNDKVFFNVSKISVGGEAGKNINEQLSSVLKRWWFFPLGENNPFGKLSKEQKELQEKLKGTTFFVNAKEEGSENVHGIDATKYRVDLDKEVLKNFLLDVGRSSGNQISPDEEAAIASSLKDIEFSGALWVGTDGAVHRIAGTVSVQPGQGPSSSFDVDYAGWDYGLDFEVAEPDPASEFNPFMLLPIASLFGNLDAPEEALDSSEAPPQGEEESPAISDKPLGVEQLKK